MKNVSLIFNIVLTIAVIVLFYLHFSTGPVKPGQSEGNVPSNDFSYSGDIVYIHLDSLINQYDMFNDLRSELEGKFQTIQNDINKRSRALESDAKDFEEKVKKGLLTRSNAETTQNQLLSREQELMNYSQEKQYEMAEEESVLYNKVMDAIMTYLDAYNAEHQHALILSTNANTNAVIKGQPQIDITKTVVTGLNDEYVKTKSNRKR